MERREFIALAAASAGAALCHAKVANVIQPPDQKNPAVAKVVNLV